jgi:hypothetical protein
VTHEWFDVVGGPEIEQGDLLVGCPVFTPIVAHPIAKDKLVDLRAEAHDLIVLTQSCDLVVGRERVNQVVLCAAPTLQAARARSGHVLAKKGNIANLARFAIHGLHPLKAFSDAKVTRAWSVVEFAHVFTLPTNYLREFAQAAGPRLRLKPPFRELLAQRFAYFFGRIAVPETLEIPDQG